MKYHESLVRPMYDPETTYLGGTWEDIKETAKDVAEAAGEIKRAYREGESPPEEKSAAIPAGALILGAIGIALVFFGLGRRQ